MASGLLNTSTNMIMKMNDTSTINKTVSANKHDMEKMSPMEDNQSTIEISQGSKVIKNLANYETSVELANSLKILYTKYLQGAKIEESTGLMPIPTGMKMNAINELGRA